jgi:hypothetical protein
MVHNGNIIGFVGSLHPRLYEVVNALFVSALIAPEATRISPLDTLGKVKIPKVEHYEQTSTPDGEGWYDTRSKDLSTYSSLIGIPIAGTNESEFLDYNLRSHTPYLHLQCFIVSVPRMNGRTHRPDDGLKARVWPTEGTRSSRTDIIIAHKGWVAILSIASILLIVSSLISPFVHGFLTNGPDAMMNISSLATRNNPHISLPANGTFLDASDRARLLKDITVPYGDVEKRSSIGSLAIGSFEETEEPNIGSVRKGHLYD